MSSPTRLRNPIVRRFSQVYVEIPPSPLHKSWTDSTSALHVSTVSANRKENAPLQANNMFQTQPSTSGSQSRKRKLSESNSTNMVVVEIPALKKPKVAPGKKGADKPKATQTKTSAAVPRGHPSEPSEEYPNGWFYCHQCNKKRDSAGERIYALSRSRNLHFMSIRKWESNARSKIRYIQDAESNSALLASKTAKVNMSPRSRQRASIKMTLLTSRMRIISGSEQSNEIRPFAVI